MVINTLSETEIHFICTIFILAASAVPFYLSFKLRNNIRKLTIILSIFVLVHAAYHVTGVFGLDFLSEDIFEPTSIIFLLLFAFYYFKLTKRKEAIKKHE